MNNVVKILIERDGMSEAEAKELIEDARNEIQTNPFEAEDIIAEILGLELDYLFDII